MYTFKFKLSLHHEMGALCFQENGEDPVPSDSMLTKSKKISSKPYMEPI